MDLADAPITPSAFRSRFPVPAAAEPVRPAEPEAHVVDDVVAIPAIHLDARTWRMLDTAVKAYTAVVLVGAPGTGKGAIITDLVARVRADPSEFGFTGNHGTEWPDPIKRTPDETWTVVDLVGALMPTGIEGNLKWSPGVVLDAIAQDRWLILDELNRADLDKILGPLLSWLADETVELGTLTPSPSAPRVMLGWARTSHDNIVDPAEGVAATLNDPPPEQIRYLAGTDFRVLGSYNPQDATRVFGMGQALMRRLRLVPVEPVDEDGLRDLLAETAPSLGPPVREAVAALYRAHLDYPQTRLGPALFLAMTRYVEIGLEESGDDLENPTPENLHQLLAEAYVIAIGRFASNFPSERRDALRAFLTTLLGPDNSDWVAAQLAVFGSR